MCWISKNIPVMQIAEKDLIVYKVVEHIDFRSCASLIYNFKYEYNQYYAIHNIEIEKTKCCYKINKGFHSYAKIPQWLFRPNAPYRVVKCIVPKNSIYYINSSQAIVSNAIIILKKENVLSNK